MSKQAQHTPGQFDAVSGNAVDRGRVGWAVDWPSGYTSAMPNEATARACAAAPDLLAACAGLLDAIHDSMTHESQRFHAAQIDAARAAIAKAAPAPARA